jgi:hypothetical protein
VIYAQHEASVPDPGYPAPDGGIPNLCRGTNASVGGAQGGMTRGRKFPCPVCGRRVGIRPGRAGRLYPHSATEPTR